jgi:cell division protein FtsW
MLILVLIPGIGSQVNGSRSWFKIASFMIQPAEFFKILIVLYMADKLDKYYNETASFFKTIIILLLPCIIGFALIMLQPDFGTGLVMVGAIFMMCIVSKNKFRNYLIISAIGLIGVSIIITTSAYRSERILAYIDPYSDPLGSGFQAIQSLYAIGPGGILGKGFDS